MNRILKALLAGGVLLLSAGTPLGAACYDEPEIRCGVQCTRFAEGWTCFDRSNRDRACIAYGVGACGEDSSYPCCGAGMGGF